MGRAGWRIAGVYLSNTCEDYWEVCERKRAKWEMGGSAARPWGRGRGYLSVSCSSSYLLLEAGEPWLQTLRFRAFHLCLVAALGRRGIGRTSCVEGTCSELLSCSLIRLCSPILLGFLHPVPPPNQSSSAFSVSYFSVLNKRASGLKIQQFKICWKLLL